MARWDTIHADGQPRRVYVDVPGGGGAAPGVVVIQHGPGVDRFIEDRGEQLAHRGYAAAAPDLYHRQPADAGDMMTRMGRLRDREIVSDVERESAGALAVDVGATVSRSVVASGVAGAACSLPARSVATV